MIGRIWPLAALAACLAASTGASADCLYGGGRYSEGAVACLPAVVDGAEAARLQRCQGSAWMPTGVACEGTAAEAFCVDPGEQLSLRIGATRIDVCRPTGLLRITTHVSTDVTLSGGDAEPSGEGDDPDGPGGPQLADGRNIKRVKAFITSEASGDAALRLCPDAAACTGEFGREVREAIVKYLRLPANRDAAIGPDFRANWGDSRTPEALFAHVAGMSDGALVESFIATFPVP